MADKNINLALSFLGKAFTAVTRWPDEVESHFIDRAFCVGVVIPSLIGRVELQLLVHYGDGSQPTEGYHYELFWDTIESIDCLGSICDLEAKF